jgi:hypothetical protein
VSAVDLTRLTEAQSGKIRTPRATATERSDMPDAQDRLGVAAITAFTPSGLAKKVKQLLRENNVQPEDVVSISHARSGFLLAVLFLQVPYSALVVFQR